ncbi:DUF2752 domain-containing protein [Saccharopolyspora sp. HNM0983]|uniref:DUF2752 domain-containing protein n=1 Tax=Saccharopolyspora montiporae TaxID=2781240 RepID=A0A929G091_9PSEU|nr:DUF2752 domain-containing protein [Saccharopolyspora sp. HNM0983]
MIGGRRFPVRTAGLVVAAAATGLLLASGVVPLPCPFRLATGLDCPFCGGSRMLGALLTGDLPAALGFNAVALLLVLPVVCAVLVAMARYERGRARGWWPAGRSGRVLGFALLAAVVAWGVVRNLPFGPFPALRA